MMALGAVPADKRADTHAFINAKIVPKSAAAAHRGADEARAAPGTAWPPPPPPGARDGMPCGVYVSQFVLQALYRHAADHGQAS